MLEAEELKHTTEKLEIKVDATGIILSLIHCGILSKYAIVEIPNAVPLSILGK